VPSIRPVAESDHQVWLSLFADYAAFYHVELPDDAASQAWQWIHDNKEPFWCDVAEHDGKVVGMTQYQLMHRSLHQQRALVDSRLQLQRPQALRQLR